MMMVMLAVVVLVMMMMMMMMMMLATGSDGGEGNDMSMVSCVLWYINVVTKKHHLIMVPEDQRVSRCWAPGKDRVS